MKILVLTPPEDRQDRAIKLAAEIARHVEAELTLLRVIDPIPETTDPQLRPSVSELLESAAAERLGERANALREAAIPTRIELDHGVAWQCVLDRVTRERFDLVVKPASGIGAAGPVFFGSTALHLFRRCPCPIWVVGDEGTIPERVLAAVDPAEGERRRRAADAVLDWAEEIAGWRDAAPEIVSAWRSVSSIVDVPGLDPTDLKRDRDFARERAEAALDRILVDRSDAVPRGPVHIVEGSPTDALPALTAARDTDLLVMGTLARPDAIGDLIGETAESIIRQVRCSVLTVPPGSHPGDARAERAATETAEHPKRVESRQTDAPASTEDR